MTLKNPRHDYGVLSYMGLGTCWNMWGDLSQIHNLLIFLAVVAFISLRLTPRTAPKVQVHDLPIPGTNFFNPKAPKSAVRIFFTCGLLFAGQQ